MKIQLRCRVTCKPSDGAPAAFTVSILDPPWGSMGRDIAGIAIRLHTGQWYYHEQKESGPPTRTAHYLHAAMESEEEGEQAHAD